MLGGVARGGVGCEWWGVADSVGVAWPCTILHTCVVDLMRNSSKDASRREADALSTALKPVYQAAAVKEAEDRFLEFPEA